MIPDYFNTRPKIIDDISKYDFESDDISFYGRSKNLRLLADAKNIERVWITSINQKLFDEVVNYINPIVLSIHEFRVESLDSIIKLKRLKELSLDWNTKCININPLSYLDSLKILSIHDFSKLRDLSPISNLINLEILDLRGGMWNVLKVDTLRPLENLKKLKWLRLGNINVADGSLQPLTELDALRELHLSNQFETKEYARLSVKLTKTTCDYFKPFVYLNQKIDNNDIMVIGRGKPFLNSKSDKKRLDNYIKEFEILRDKYKNE